MTVPIAERHRLIFYLGHLEAFDWNILGRRSLGAAAFQPEFDTLFERGIDPPPGQAPADSPRDWPSRAEVERYGARTRAWIDAHLKNWILALVQMVVEHRHMHAETFAYLLHGLPYDEKAGNRGRRGIAASRAGKSDDPSNSRRCSHAWKRHGSFRLGQRASRARCCRSGIPHFEVQDLERRVSRVRARRRPASPHFWLREGDAWFYRGMFAKIPAAARLARLGDLAAGRRVCEMARSCFAHRSAIPSRGSAHARPHPVRDNSASTAGTRLRLTPATRPPTAARPCR